MHIIPSKQTEPSTTPTVSQSTLSAYVAEAYVLGCRFGATLRPVDPDDTVAHVAERLNLVDDPIVRRFLEGIRDAVRVDDSAFDFSCCDNDSNCLHAQATAGRIAEIRAGRPS